MSETPSAQVPEQDLAIPTVTPVPTPGMESGKTPYIRFEDAVSVLGEHFDWDPLTNPDQVQSFRKSDEEITILFIQGVNLDSAGNARLWAFGTRTVNGTQLRAYDGLEWTIFALDDPFVSDEIDTDRVITPGVLFEQNRELIFRNTPPDTELREIELKDGVYSLTPGYIPGILRFNATTGEPIESDA